MNKSNILSQIENLQESLLKEMHKLENTRMNPSQKSDKIYLESWYNTMQEMEYEITHTR